MSKSRVAAFLSILLLGSACTTTKDFSSSGYSAPEAGYKLVVMEPDVSVSLLTIGGVNEPREDWTNEATVNITKALSKHQMSRGGNAVVAMTRDEAGGDSAALRELVSLHNAVGQSIFIHKYSGQKLPTKKETFDWTLGETAVNYGQQSGYDYALFLHAENSFSSGARKGLQVAGLLSCAVGVCVGVSGGQQIAFASLVDLDSGQVTWFNVLSSTVGDIRTEEGAENMVEKLLESMEEPTER